MTTTIKLTAKFAILLFFALSLVNSLSAQTLPPLDLGKVNGFYDQFHKQFVTTGKDANTVSINVSATQSLKIKLRSSSKKDNFHETSGEVINEKNSSFYLSGTSSSLHGYILLRDQKKGYKFYSDANGNAYIKPEDINKIICVDYDSVNKPTNSTKGPKTLESAAAVPLLQSLPGAEAVVLLDFDGQYVVSQSWNNGNPIDAQPYNGSDQDIREIFELISEDYRPFVLNITTDESVYLAAPANRRTRCIFTPTNTAGPGYGGIAYIGSFTWGSEIPCWVFNSGAKYAGEAGSHEIGHTLNLHHDGRTNPVEEYYEGVLFGTWAPIMGAAYYNYVSQFSKGEYNYANNQEDDIAIIAGNNGFTLRTDQYGNTNATATPFMRAADNTVSLSGVIEQRTDLDVFSFSTSGGNLNLTISPASSFIDLSIPNLNISATLRNSSGTVIASSDPSGLDPVTFNLNLTAATYYLEIDGVGEGDPATNGYSDYGSLGYFSISGTLPPAIGNNANLALGKPAFSSSNESGSLTPNQAVDGSTSTRWASAFSDPQWIYVDLGQDYNINRVKINWEAAYGKDYTIQVSTNAYFWANIKSVTGNAALVNDWTGLNGNGRYIRIYGTSRGTAYGYSIIELEVYGTTIGNQTPTASITSPANNATFTAPATITINAFAADADGTVSKVEFYNEAIKLGEDLTSPYSFVWSGVAAGTYSLTVKAIDNAGAIGTSAAVTVVVNTTASSNLALNRPVTVSSVENSGTPGSAAVDGNLNSRWSTSWSDPQWIYVDLGLSYLVTRVKITWESAYGKDYLIQVSDDPNVWTGTIKTVTGNSSLVNDWTGLSGTGRYMRIYGTARGTGWGYSIYELEVYGTTSYRFASSQDGDSDVETAANLAAYPNPASEQVFVNVHADADQNVTVSLHDLNANEVASQTYGVAKGNQQIAMPVAAYGNGMYLIVVTNSNGRKTTQKISIQR